MTTDTTQSKKNQTLNGTVVAQASTDTATVLVERFIKHPRYEKFIRKEKKYLVHCPEGCDVTEGESVTIRACRPISKRKRFEIVPESSE